MDISIVIPTCNRVRYLAEALDSLTRIHFDFNRFEIIVADNFPNGEVSRMLAANQYPFVLRYLEVMSPGLHHCRHQGLAASQADVICYLDDDVVVDVDWLSGVWECFEKTDAVCVGGPSVPLYEKDPPNWLNEMWQSVSGGKVLGPLSLIELSEGMQPVHPMWIFGCNFSIKKEIVLRCGGFHPDSVPQNRIEYRGDGETGLSFEIVRNEYKSYHHSKAKIWHRVPVSRMTPFYFYKRMFNQGISDSYTEIRKKKGIDNAHVVDTALVNDAMNAAAYFAGASPSSMDESLNNMNQQMGRYQKLGKIYHQVQVSKRDDLLAYVLKENYF